MKRLILLPFLALVAACGQKPPIRQPEPIFVTKEVKVPVSLPCVPANYNPLDPDYVDSDEKLKAAKDPAERYQLLWGGRAQRIARDKEKTVVISKCPQEGVE